ncbi:putative membrane protein YecN with MAPEG domain [Sphingomonas sp. UYAg733]
MGMVMLPVTLVTAGGAALIALWLAIRVGQVRTTAKVSIGDGGDERLICRMRAQANFVEYAPFIVILIGLLEFTAGTATWLWVASTLFLLARVAHPLGMDGLKYARMAGTLVTFLLLLGLGGYAIALPLIAMEHAPANDPVEVVAPAG